MKTVLIAAFAVLTIGTSAKAAPENSKMDSHFATAFKNAENVNWTNVGAYNKATFTVNSKSVEAFYNADGELVGVSRTVQFDKLPKAAIETITSKYLFPDYQLAECIEFVNGDHETNYYVSMNHGNETRVLEITPKGKVTTYTRKWH